VIKHVRVKFSIFIVTLAISLVAASSAFGQANIVILNADTAGTGFNDQTPVSPVGGNSGTTLGQQRLIAFQTAASIWGATLNSGPTITVRSSWAGLSCTSTTATLGSAGPAGLARDFPNAPFTGTWYPTALANALTGTDPSTSPEITARFNLNIGTSGCLDNRHWYLGLDGNHGSTGIDLVAVLLHEFAHGLGFQTFTDEETGNFAGGTGGSFPSVWDRFLRDDSTGKLWVNMTSAERVASAVNSGNLVWAGPQLTDSVPGALVSGADSSNRVLMYAPNPIESGSSVSHFDRSAAPNLLMEPNISSDLDHSVAPPNDLTLPLLKDIGWNSSVNSSPPPPNDNFAAAQVISGCFVALTSTNAGSTKESGEPDHASNGGTHSVWYQWQAPATGSVTIDTAGSNFDTVLGVYTGSAVNALTTIGQNDDATSGDTTSSVIFNATAGVVYRIAVAGFNNQGFGGDVGQFGFHLSAANCSNLWIPTVLNASQVEMKSWTISGVTSVYVKLTFPDAGYRVANWGTPQLAQNAWTVDATVERFNGGSAQVITNTAQIYQLGSIPAGSYTFTFKNSGTTVKTLSFTVTSQSPPANPIDDPREFVRWQYKDFLRREPDAPGWDHWTAEITQCSDPASRFPGETEGACVSRKRANTSAAFFMSPEFQNTGYFVLRVYRGSLGRMPHFGGTGSANDEFTRDAATVAAGIVVNNQLSPAVINANKQAFVNQFVTRADFLAIYGGLNNTQYVDKLFQTTGIAPTGAERQALIDGLGNSSETRASVLFKVVDGTQTVTDGQLVFNTNYGKAFYDAQFNPAFVQMEYFGYLLRDPDDAGYTFWLNKLNTVGNWVDAQMVLAFITSPEYRSRFGSP
jgi:Domain of unknown function (DUF4214)